MRRIGDMILAVLALAIASSLAAGQTVPPLTPNLEWKGRIVVEFNAALGNIHVEHGGGIAITGDQRLDALARQFAVYEIQPAIPGAQKPTNAEIRDLSRFYILEFPLEVDLHEVAQAYAEESIVITAEPYYVRRCDYTPNDPMFPQQWALEITNAETAYDYCQGSASVIVGVVDSGTDTAHLDLRDNLWINPGEDLNGNGVIEPSEWNRIDDDQNGYIDDFWGWNVWQNNNNVQDPPISQGGGHGTACAGNASAVTDNGVGISSLGWCAKIMTAKAGDGMYIYASAAGITYLASNGANVISLSYGGPYYSTFEQAAVNNAWQQGAIIVASAGSDSNPRYPSAYNNAVAVTATDPNDHLCSFAGYGTWVDICAPGENILSTIPGNSYASWSGTSFSAPQVGGLACLVWAARPDFTNDEVLEHIYSTCVNIDSLNPGYAGLLGPGRIDAGAAIAVLYALQITLTPYGAPIEIPASGGAFNYNIMATNSSTGAVTFEVWCDMTLPNGSHHGPFLGPVTVTLPVGGSINRDRTQNVPGRAPAGQYSYNGNVGIYPNTIWSQDSFDFTKLGAGGWGLGAGDWTNTGESFNLEAAAEMMPDVFSLEKPHPNPFNPTTVASFELQDASYVSLKVYDIAGRLAATLVEGWREAGVHEVTFDGSGLASGVYIVRIEATGQQALQKIVLMK